MLARYVDIMLILVCRYVDIMLILVCRYALTDADIFLDPEVNILGARFMSTVNSVANALNSWPVLDEELQTG